MIVVGHYGIMLVIDVSVRPSISLFYICPSVFSFLEDDFMKNKWIIAKLCMCIDFVEV